MNTLNMWASIITVVFGFIGQTWFMALFITRPWRLHNIGRAWFHKSNAFWLLFLLSLSRLLLRGPRQGVEDPYWYIALSVLVEAYILFAIWNQLFALRREMRNPTADPRFVP